MEAAFPSPTTLLVKKIIMQTQKNSPILARQLCSSDTLGWRLLNRNFRNGICNSRLRLPVRASSSSSSSSSQCFFNPVANEPILREAIKEPVAFLGGVFAGILRLDMEEDPLKEWVTRTAEASGLTKEVDVRDTNLEEEAPRQIEIE